MVLEARLRSLGVSSDSAVHLHGDKDWFGLYDEEDPTQGSGGVGYEKTSDLHVYPGAWEAVPAQPLQTITVSHQEVLRNIDDWKGAISDELGNVFDVHQAMRRRRSSIVKVEAAVTNAELCHLRAAGHRAVTNQWRTSGADIRTAFLLAPLRQQSKRIFLRPPSVLKQAGFAAEGEFWEITGALYGLQDSPADWAMYRDETLPTIEIVYRERTTYLTRSKYEPNMWLLYCPFTSELLAALTIYVDDLLLSGTAEASEAIWTAIKGKWKISEPDYADEGHAITFCGFEIEQKTDGIHVGQSKYIQS
ncbi:GIP, partial [Symbiodinium microadriaticum]